MGLIDSLRKYCILKSVRDRSTEQPPDKYDKLKFKYLEISIREYMMSGTDNKLEKMKKKGRKNIDEHIKKAKKMNHQELVSFYGDVTNTKKETQANENLWSRWGKFADKSNFVYSEYDRLINFLKEEMTKKKPSN